MSAARRLAALGAVLVAAWFALGVVQATGTSAAQDALDRRDDASGALDRAAVLNPDQTVDVLRAQQAANAGDLPQAQRILERVVDAHPDDLEAWFRLALATREREPAVAQRAAAAARRLSPPVG